MKRHDTERGDQADRPARDGSGGPVPALWIGVAILVCCAGPLLIAGGTLGLLGAWLRSGWIVVLAGAAVVAVVAWIAVRNRCRLRPTSRPRGGDAES